MDFSIDQPSYVTSKKEKYRMDSSTRFVQYQPGSLLPTPRHLCLVSHQKKLPLTTLENLTLSKLGD
jgi:hypothetical protein